MSKKGVKSLNALRKKVYLWHSQIEAWLDDPRKVVKNDDTANIAVNILNYTYLKGHITKEDLKKVLCEEPSLSPTRVCSNCFKPSVVSPGQRQSRKDKQNDVLQTPTNSVSGNQTRCEQAKSKLQPREAWGSPLQQTDPVKVHLNFDYGEDEQLSESMQKNKDLKEQNSNLKQEVEQLKTYIKKLEDDKQRLCSEFERIDKEKKTMELKYQKEYTGLVAEFNIYKAEMNNKIAKFGDKCKIRAMRYRAERDDAQYDTERLNDALQKTDEELKDAKDAITHYQEEAIRYKTALEKVNAEVSLTKMEKEEILSLLKKQKSITEAETINNSKIINNLQNVIKEMEAENINIKHHVTQLTKNVEQTKLCNSHTNERCKHQQAEKRYRDERDQANHDVESLNSKVRELTDKLNKQHIARQQFENNIKELKDQLVHINKERNGEGYNDENTRYRDTITNMEKERNIEVTKLQGLVNQLRLELKIIKSHEEHEKNSIKHELSRLKEDNHHLENDKHILEKEIQLLTDRKLELQKRLQQAESQVKSQQTLIEEIESLKKALTIANMDRKQFEERLKQAELQLKSQQTSIDENESLKKALTTANMDRKQSEERCKTETEVRISRDKVSTELRIENDRLRKERNEARSELQKRTEEKNQLAQKLQTEINVAKQEHEQLKKDKDDLISVFKETSNRDKETISQLERTCENLTARYEKEKTQIHSDKNDTCNKLSIENDRLRIEMNATKAKLLEIEEMFQERKQEITAAKAQHEKLNKEKDDHIRLLKDESNKSKEKCHKLEREIETLNLRYSSEETMHQHNAYELVQLRNDVKVCKNEKAQLEEALKYQKKDNIELENKLRDLELKGSKCGQCDQYERTMAKLKKENQELLDKYNIASTNANNGKKTIQELLGSVENGSKEKQNLESIAFKLGEDLENLKRSYESLQDENFSLSRRAENVLSENADLKQKCKTKDDHLQKADKDNRQLKADIDQLRSYIIGHKQEIETLNTRIEILREEKLELETRTRSRSPQVTSDPKQCQNCWKYKNDISDLKKEVNSLRDRLSEAAGNKLRDNNPNIADLSDMNRPTSLAEKFSTLYTDEYTDAMEAMEHNMSEADCVGTMLKWLKSCYDWCERIATEQREMLTEQSIGFMHKYLGKSEHFVISARCLIHVKEFQKKIAVDSLIAVGKICHKMSLNEETLLNDNQITKYIKKCSELCWMMQITDPPLCLKFDVKRGESLDRNCYNVFTKSGSKVDFLVWPVLYLHKTGPLLAKGVAQGM